MRDQKFGRIINTTSASGLFGNFGQANYGAAKAGLVGLTRVLALEGERYDIKVNAIAPIGMTRMSEGIFEVLGELSYRATANAVSPMVAYLAHENCAVSGNIYSVAGGRVARILIAETEGVVLEDNTSEAIAERIEQIDRIGEGELLFPSSLDGETEIIGRLLSEG